MKQIINNKLYDTEKAELLYSYLKNVPIMKSILEYTYEINCWRDADLYVTKKKNYFVHIKQANKSRNNSLYIGSLEEYIEEISKEEAKSLIQKLNPNKAIELFGEVEDA